MYCSRKGFSTNNASIYFGPKVCSRYGIIFSKDLVRSVVAHFIFRGHPRPSTYFSWTRKSRGSGKSYNFASSGTFLDEKLIFVDYWYVLRTSSMDFAKFPLTYKIQPAEFSWTDFCIFGLDLNRGPAGALKTMQAALHACCAQSDGWYPMRRKFCH